MKGLGILLVGVLAVAGGVVAATYITKKKLEKENEENYYDDWDDDFDDDDLDFEFDEDEDISAAPEQAEEAPVSKLNDELTEDEDKADDEGEL